MNEIKLIYKEMHLKINKRMIVIKIKMTVIKTSTKNCSIIITILFITYYLYLISTLNFSKNAFIQSDNKWLIYMSKNVSIIKTTIYY